MQYVTWNCSVFSVGCCIHRRQGDPSGDWHQNQVNLCWFLVSWDEAKNSLKLLLLKFLPLIYHHSHFFDHHLYCTTFFTLAFLHKATTIYRLISCFWVVDITCFCKYTWLVPFSLKFYGRCSRTFKNFIWYRSVNLLISTPGHDWA